MKLSAFLQAKALVALVASVLLVGGVTAAFASTQAGDTGGQSSTHAHAVATAAATHGAQGSARETAGTARASCPGQPEAQHLAASYQLSTASSGPAVTAICALHQGTFTGSTTGGASVTSSRVYGYGEIDQLLTLAQYLAAHGHANAGGKLSDSNVSAYLATALHTCGSTALATCLTATMPGWTPESSHGNKPTSTPTPRDHKPTATPTPHH